MFEEAQMTNTATAEPQEALIAVTQLPVITERLREVKAQVEQAVTEAKSMVATAETVQAVKTRRAELNKTFEALEKQRKAVKDQIMEPYNRLEAVYKECITGPFKEADRSLKATVDDFETDLKEKAKAKLQDYYGELCQQEQIDWLPFDRAMSIGGIKIGMADTKANTPRKLMDAIAGVVAKIAVGISDIQRMEDSAEIMAEYKVCLDVGKAVANVQERKRRVQEEKERSENVREWEQKRAEALAKVEAVTQAAPAPVQAPTEVASPEAEPRQGTPATKKIRFTIYIETREQYDAVLPILRTLKTTLMKEGIRYE